MPRKGERPEGIASAIRVYHAIMSLWVESAEDSDSGVMPSTREIARRTKMSLCGIQMATQRLIRWGWVERTQSPRSIRLTRPTERGLSVQQLKAQMEEMK